MCLICHPGGVPSFEEIQVHDRYQPDVDAYVRSCQTGPCFVCEIVAGNPKYRHHIVYEHDSTHLGSSRSSTSG